MGCAEPERPWDGQVATLREEAGTGQGRIEGEPGWIIVGRPVRARPSLPVLTPFLEDRGTGVLHGELVLRGGDPAHWQPSQEEQSQQGLEDTGVGTRPGQCRIRGGS